MRPLEPIAEGDHESRWSALDSLRSSLRLSKRESHLDLPLPANAVYHREERAASNPLYSGEAFPGDDPVFSNNDGKLRNRPRSTPRRVVYVCAVLLAVAAAAIAAGVILGSHTASAPAPTPQPVHTLLLTGAPSVA